MVKIATIIFFGVFALSFFLGGIQYAPLIEAIAAAFIALGLILKK